MMLLNHTCCSCLPQHIQLISGVRTLDVSMFMKEGFHAPSPKQLLRCSSGIFWLEEKELRESEKTVLLTE